ncbi:aspartate/glutamate racemase family protein [Acetobacter fallax]|uniref:Asp/Glu racemase n=1 Tax=Acetobacter fallax TaxID=1737473 RepID=A0ABX0K4Y3_9PROT|nr:aspartate/glutamate racemase family protein [Acetobacter fallax]NHO31434.1 Asp/Glu racemase [Acetobacter fallax]NHO34982.1 Asp/Glu racemase [Acetobacter fallax]
MRHLLILNPNTDPTLTQTLLTRARALLPANIVVSGTTAPFGARYIACRASLTIAAHASLDAFAQARNLIAPDTTVLIACFGDPGLAALQEIADCPVTGMARASLEACRAKGGRTGILTGGDAWKPMIEELVVTEGFSASVAGVSTIPVSGEHAGQQRAATLQALTHAARHLIEHTHADRILIAGAGLAGLSSELARHLPVPVHCSLEESLLHIARIPLQTTKTSEQPLITTGLSAALANLLRHPT